MSIAPATLARVLAALEPVLADMPLGEAVTVLTALEAPWQARQRTMATRAAAITRAVAAAQQPTLHLACTALERTLKRRAVGAPIDQELLLHADEVLAACGGKPLGWRQIYRDVKKASFVKNSGGDDKLF